MVVLCATVFGTMIPLNRDPLWPIMILGALALIGVLNYGVLAAILRRGAARAFWLSFALFGWTTFLPLSIFILEWPPAMLIIPPFAWIGGQVGRSLWIAGSADTPPAPKSGAAPPISYETPEDSPDGCDPVAPAGRI